MTVNYREYGQLKSKNATNNLVLVHPFPFDSRIWDQLASKLSDSNYLIAPDLRGCGQTALGTEEPNLDLLARDLIELIESIGLTKVILAGISLGGYVAMAMARLDPSLISGLILLDTKASSDSPQAKENRFRIARQMSENSKTSLFVTQMAENIVSTNTKLNKSEVYEQVISWMTEAKPETIAWLQIAMANRPASFLTLAQIDVPTLLIRGSADSISTEMDFLEMKKYLKQVTSIEIENAGHLPIIEDPVATANAIETWLTTFAK